MGEDRRRPGGEDGAVAIESAIVLGIFFFLLFAVIEFGYLFWIWNSVNFASQEGGRYAMVNNNGPPASCVASPKTTVNCTIAATKAGFLGLDPTNLVVTTSTTPGATPPTMTVTASYQFSLAMFNLLPAGGVNIVSAVTVPCSLPSGSCWP